MSKFGGKGVGHGLVTEKEIRLGSNNFLGKKKQNEQSMDKGTKLFQGKANISIWLNMGEGQG